MKKIVALIITIGALALVFTRVPLAALLRAFREIHFQWFIAAGAVFGLSLLLAAVRWHLLLRLNLAGVSFSTTFRTLLVAHLGNIAFLGSAGGDVTRTVLYKKWFGIPIARVINSTLHDRLFIIAGFFSFLVLTIFFGAPPPAPDFFQVSFPGLKKSWPLLLAGFLVISGFALWKWTLFRAALIPILVGLKNILIQPRQAVGIFLLSLFIQGLYSASFALTLRSFTGDFLWLDFFWFFPLILFVAALPISIGGLGVREGTSVFLLNMGGISEPTALAASLSFFALACLWSVWGAAYFYQYQKTAPGDRPQKISCVIPVLNEEQRIENLLVQLRNIPEIDQVVVVDGGSSDATVARSNAFRVEVVVAASPGRGAQMNLGFARARNPIVWFLHADSRVSPEAGSAIVSALFDPTVAGGGLWKTFQEKNLLLRGSRFRCWLRMVLWRRVMADQGIFVRRKVLEETGGVPEMRLMEEFELCRKIRSKGRLVLADAVITTSARKFLQHGVLRTYLLMGRVTVLYYCGVHPDRLAEIYQDHR